MSYNILINNLYVNDNGNGTPLSGTAAYYDPVAQQMASVDLLVSYSTEFGYYALNLLNLVNLSSSQFRGIIRLTDGVYNWNFVVYPVSQGLLPGNQLGLIYVLSSDVDFSSMETLTDPNYAVSTISPSFCNGAILMDGTTLNPCPLQSYDFSKPPTKPDQFTIPKSIVNNRGVGCPSPYYTTSYDADGNTVCTLQSSSSSSSYMWIIVIVLFLLVILVIASVIIGGIGYAKYNKKQTAIPQNY